MRTLKIKNYRYNRNHDKKIEHSGKIIHLLANEWDVNSKKKERALI